MGVITENGGSNPCVCGSIHPCCRFLVDGGCPHRTPGSNHHALKVGEGGSSPWSDPGHDIADDQRRFHAEAPARHRALVEAQAREARARAVLTDRVQAAIAGDLKRQDAVYPGFRAERTSKPNLFAVDGIVSADELASAVVDVFVEWSRGSTLGSGPGSDGRG